MQAARLENAAALLAWADRVVQLAPPAGEPTVPPERVASVGFGADL